ncbi:MAG: hypothetical protein ACUVXJ_02505 [Phycisphaerae bacterium]
MTPSAPVDFPVGRQAIPAPDIPTDDIRRSTCRRTAAGLVCAAALFVLYRTWVSDDAFITFRHVANFLAGHGPVFNPGERVQGFSHPLWFFLLAAGGRLFDVYGVAVALGLLLTVAMFGTQAWLLRNERHGVLRLQFMVLMLLSSKTFVEFQTSGLETSLTNALASSLWALLAARGLAAKQPPLTAAAWLCGLLVLTRPDLVVLTAPVALYLLACLLKKRPKLAPPANQENKENSAGGPSRRWLGPAFALLVVVGWYGFATIYYGTPLPNTAYAKVTMPLSAALPMGAHYVMDYARSEPIHALLILIAIGGGLAFAVLSWLRRQAGKGVVGWLGLGIACHVAYVMSIGGDFMRGRFMDPALTTSVVLAAWLLGHLLSHTNVSPKAVTSAIGLAGTAFLLVQVRSPVALSCIGRGADELVYRITRWPAATTLGLIGYAACCVLLIGWIGRAHGLRARSVFTILVVIEVVVLFGLVGLWQPTWGGVGVLAGAGLCVASCLAIGFVGGGLQHKGAGLAVCLLIAAGASLVDVGRPREGGQGAISDDYSFYWVGKWHNPFRHPTEALRGSTLSWLRFGTAARRYAERYGPITIATDSLGIISYYAGPDVRVIDLYGLTDPYLARSESPPCGRPGHIKFRIPPGYLEDRSTVNLLPDWLERLSLMDSELANDARKLPAEAVWGNNVDKERWLATQRVISGPVFSRQRLADIPRYMWPQRHYVPDSPEGDPVRARVSPRLGPYQRAVLEKVVPLVPVVEGREAARWRPAHGHQRILKDPAWFRIVLSRISNY